MKVKRIAMLFVALCTCARAATPQESGGIPYPEALKRADIALPSLGQPINDALILGNGDLNGLFFADGADLVFRITKNDVWDARLDAELNPPIPTLERLKQLGRGEWPDRNWILPEGYKYEGNDAYGAHPYPCPRACGVVRIPGAASGLHAAALSLRFAEAAVCAQECVTRVLTPAQSNVILFRSEQSPGTVLEPIVSSDIPAAETGEQEGATWLRQEIPGDLDWPGMTFAAARVAEGELAAVAVVTSRESAEPLAAAIQLARDAIARPFDDTVSGHRAVWEDFWARSGFQAEDPVLERVWYRNLYFLRCVTKPGVISPGLFAGLLDDAPAWHGDFHTNYNIQQTFWSAFATNHCELVEPYDRLISEYLPRAQWLAKNIFGSDGAFYPHVLFAYEPPDPETCKSPHGRQYIHHVWAFTMGVTGFTVQPLWWHYKYAPDRAFLEEVAYPAVRGAAEFYADFVDTCERDGDHVVLAPTVSLEHHGWTAGFERNRDCAFCIAYFRMVFDAAIEAAGILDTDGGQAARWSSARDLLPDYPRFTDKEPIIVDVAGAPPITYNIPVPTTPVFPADQIGWFSPPEVQDIFRRTAAGLRHNGNNAPIMLAAAKARLGMPDAHEWLRTEIQWRERPNGTLSFNRLEPQFGFNDFGHYTEMFGVCLPINELLLQSVGDVIRLFPAWPGHMGARFANMRTQGGFLVSAGFSGGQAQDVTIESTAGGPLRLQAPWPKTEVLVEGGWRPCAADDRGILAVATESGQVFRFRPHPVWTQVRAQGTEQSFRFEDGAAVMRIQGAPGVSTGYQMPGTGAAAITEVAWDVKGSSNAQYFVEVTTSEGPRVTGWTRSPQDWTKGRLELPAGASVSHIVLYTQSDDGAAAFNAFRELVFKPSGPAEEIALDLEAHE
ncbi:MAG TPA: hypothetical protein PLM14_10695 [Candidatus Hydrogenedentes bacterium]|nr:hypothetical protein [Candidatus Hydrogenedentota bacterium]